MTELTERETSSTPSRAATADASAWRPRVWVAVVLSILVPGLGHLYVGRPARGVATLVALHLLALAAVLLALDLPGAPLRLLLILVLLLVGVAAAPADAARVARRAPAAAKRPYQRWFVLAAVWLVATIVGPDWLAGVVERNVAKSFRVPTAAMDPTLVIGDYILVRRRVPRALERGAVVVYRAGTPSREYVHRVVGVPGDTLEMRDFRLFRNGAPADEPYPHSEDGGTATRERSPGTWGPLVVPRDSLFLLGDDRAHSFDSRFRGFIPRGSVVGVPAWIYYSRDPGTDEVRLDRVGLRVE